MVVETTSAGEIMLIPSADSTTMRTGLASIPWINFHDRDAKSKGLVSDELLQLVESPGVEVCPLCFAMFGTSPDAGQVFKDNGRIGILGSKFYDAFADHMIGVALKASLFARQPFQGAFSALCAFLLKTLSHSPVVMLALFNLPATDEDSMPIGPHGGSKIIHSKVYADDRLGLLDGHLLGVGFEGDMKIEDPVSFTERS